MPQWVVLDVQDLDLTKPGPLPRPLERVGDAKVFVRALIGTHKNIRLLGYTPELNMLNEFNGILGAVKFKKAELEKNGRQPYRQMELGKQLLFSRAL